MLGGAILSLGRQVFGDSFLAFGLVFACQSVGMVLAFLLLTRVNVQTFKQESGDAIAALMELELD